MGTHAAFENNFVSILDIYAPKKIGNFTRESKSHFNMILWEQIMIKSCFKSNSNKSENPTDIVKFK